MMTDRLTGTTTLVHELRVNYSSYLHFQSSFNVWRQVGVAGFLTLVHRLLTKCLVESLWKKQWVCHPYITP